MSCLIWNARGLGNQHAIHNLRLLIATRNPQLLLICETKLVASQCNKFRFKFQYTGLFSVDSEGRRGGLMILGESLLM